MPVARIPGGLTKPQREQLLLLLRVGADSRESAKHRFDDGCSGLQPNSIGSLVGRGLACAKAVRHSPGGSQVTVYWLTPSGLDLAPRVAAALSKKHRSLAA